MQGFSLITETLKHPTTFLYKVTTAQHSTLLQNVKTADRTNNKREAIVIRAEQNCTFFATAAAVEIKFRLPNDIIRRYKRSYIVTKYTKYRKRGGRKQVNDL